MREKTSFEKFSGKSPFIFFSGVGDFDAGIIRIKVYGTTCFV